MLPQQMLRRSFAALIMALISGGCFSADPPDLRSRHAPHKIPAIKSAVQNQDKAAVPQLVHDLDSDDPAVRFYAIEGLQRLTSETFGYLYYADAPARREAVMKWRKWLEEQHR